MKLPAGMIRGQYSIYTAKYDKTTRRNKVFTVHGYLYHYNGFTYGMSKVKDVWVVTETSTGLATGMYTHQLKEIPAKFEEWDKAGKLAIIEKKVKYPDYRVKEAKIAIELATLRG